MWSGVMTDAVRIPGNESMPRVGVRALCDFTARRGDLDHRFTPSPNARDGLEGQARVVATRGEGYRAEVSVAEEVAGLRIQGRIDGVCRDGRTLEEIKTYRGRLERMADNQRALHWAQVRAYGALWCREQGLEEVTLVLVYVDSANWRETRLTETCQAEALWWELEQRCRDYRQWGESEVAHRRARDASLAQLAFPWPDFRPGQRELAETVYKAAATGRELLVEAPTGIGKTLGTLFPTLKAMPRHALDRLAFLTMKTPGRQVALDALRKLFPQPDAPLRVLELIARQKACEYPGRACHGDACPLAQGFYDRLPAAREAAATHAWLDREGLRDIASQHQLCPYYLGQEMARWSDVLVADVNHYFDTSALLHGLCRSEEWRMAVLIDEAHNLVDRARGMYSAGLDQRRMAGWHREAPQGVKRSLGRVVRCWQALIREQYEVDVAVPTAPEDTTHWRQLEVLPEQLVGALQSASSAISDHLAEHPEDGSGMLTDCLFELLAFTRLAETFGDHSLCELTRQGRGRSQLAIVNLIPADFLAPRFSSASTCTLFSATLSPAHYQRDLLGLPQHTVWYEVASPFSAEQLEVRVCRHLSTRYRDRERSLPGIVETLADQYRRQPGHYLAFVSSFHYLQQLYEALAKAWPEIPLRRQQRSMSEEQRNQFVADFRPGGRGIALAVLGGAFAEGIDLPGDRLIGAFIATLGLPPREPRQEVLKQRLETRFGCGDDYAYRIPGLIKVVQAAGRVIRQPEDRGVVVLMDDRYASPEVQSRLPGWWRGAS